MRRASISALLLVAVANVAVALALLASIELAAGFFVEPLLKRPLAHDAITETMTWLDINPTPQVRDPELLWRNTPGAKRTRPVNPKPFGRNDSWTIQINSEGFRGAERRATSGDVFRILCVGDSITFGFNVDQPDTYPEQLSSLLAERHPHARIEVINAGTPGWSWVQGLRFLDRYGLDLDPDLVVIGHGTNDQFFPSRITDEELLLQLAAPWQRWRHSISDFAAATNIYRAIARVRPDDEENEPVSRGCREQIARELGCHRVSLAQIATAVEEVSRLAKARGASVLVLNTDFFGTAAIRGLRAGVERARVPFLDLAGEFARRQGLRDADRAKRLDLPAGGEIESKPASSPATAKRAIVRVEVPDRGLSYSVAGDGHPLPQFSFAKPIGDDGRGGDERAGDGVFTATIDVPAELPGIAYRFFQGETPELTPLPPVASTLGDRVLPTPGSRLGPVHEFGKTWLMAERTHPDREGHRLIAELVGRHVEGLPEFEAHLGSARAGN